MLEVTSKTVMKTFSVQLVQETSKRYYLPSKGIIRCADDIKYIVDEVLNLSNRPKEHLVLLSLNTKNKVTGIHIVHIGSVNASIVHPRELFQLAILDNATSIVMVHNHPSGDTTPSQEDIRVTRRIKEAGKVIGIELLDHIIVGDNYKSLRELGYV